MKRVSFECEIITPMFMYGGDGQTLELRPSEFKGMLRFWWRALHPDLSLKGLKEKENKIFGSTDRKSGFRIVIERNYLIEGKYFLLPHKQKANFSAYLPKSLFNITFIFSNEKYVEMIKNLFILSTIIGDFGKRSRRGFGSIKINRIDEERFAYETYLSIDKLKELIKLINQKFKFNFMKNKINYPFIKKIEIGDKLYQSYDELLKHIGRMTHNCKCGKSGVFQEIDRFASPVYVSAIKKRKDYFPIITTLNIALPENNEFKKEQIDTDVINKFKNSILNKTKEC